MFYETQILNRSTNTNKNIKYQTQNVKYTKCKIKIQNAKKMKPKSKYENIEEKYKKAVDMNCKFPAELLE